MQSHKQKSSLLPLASLPTVLLGTALGGCTGSGDDSGVVFQSHNTKVSVAQDTTVELGERWLLFLADEFTTGAAGTNYNAANGDGDVTDSIAVVVDMVSQKETNLRVAAEELSVLGSGTGARLFLVVIEADDSKDWSGDTFTDDVVLLTCPASTASNAALTYVATLDGGGSPQMLEAGGRLYFVEDPSATTALAVGETAINYVTLGQPTAPVRVLHAYAPDLEAMEEPDLLAVDEDLIFFTLDENVESATIGGAAGVDLNADLDTTDLFVLGLLDGTDPAALARNVERAVVSDSGPVRALKKAANDWLVAFLVNEAAQGAVNLNAPTSPDLPGGWKPTQCTTDDADTLDDVLGYLQYALWAANPVTNPPKNTGLVGTDRVLAVDAGAKFFVATISNEAAAECNLNGDADVAPFPDEVFRWAPVGAGTAFFTSASGLFALEDVPGGTEGATDMPPRFLVVVNEAEDDRDHNGQVMGNSGFKTQELVAWINPGAASPTWQFDHSASLGIQAAGTDWMAEREQRDRLLVTFQESLIGVSINGGGDSDTLDSAPSFAFFDSTGDLDFPGPPIAIDSGNAGIVIAGQVALYRVDEAEDNRDWNGDTLKNDFVLFRTTVATLQNSNFLGTLSNLPRPAAESSSVGSAYLSDEAMAGADLNGDNQVGGLVLRWFRLP